MHIVRVLAVLAVVGCEDYGCVEADELNNKAVKVSANPVNDGVSGVYNHQNGGQVAQWHETGLLTAPEDMIVIVSGNWRPWMSSKSVESLKRCKMCSKRNNSVDENCICSVGEVSVPEIGVNGKPVAADCVDDPDNDLANGVDQGDPKLCSCTKNNGLRTDYGVFHFPLNYFDKDHSVRLPDDQDEPCYYDQGLGLYLGVFGRSGSELPLRAYHLFSEEEICSIKRNKDGECVDENGKDRTRYIFRSKNAKPLVKDDLAGNDGLDASEGDDIYHKPNEFIKLIIYDGYYSDNMGEYKVEFVKGVASDDDIGLLEALVGIVEDEMMGEINENGEREGGILKFMYNAIVKDRTFMGLFQMSLVLYIAFFGLSSLMGLVELSQKEIYSRVVKVAVVIFLINPNSWQFYDDIVIGFFKDGMGTVIDIVANVADVEYDKDTNPIMLAQQASANPASTASRFSYIDMMIRTLFSSAVTKKIWGLFYYRIYGILLIVMIYFLIFYFVYVMLLAAAAYAITLMKLLFGLALGPFFIALALFKQTNEITKKWIGFVGARSIEIIILFLLLYMFVTLIDKKFNEILYFSVCSTKVNFGLFSLYFLVAESSRSFVDWMSLGAVLGLFIFMANMVIMQIPTLSGALITIGGQANSTSSSNYASGGFKMAAQMAGDAFDAAKGAAGFAVEKGGGQGFRALRNLSRATGLSGAVDKGFSRVPFRGPRAVWRDSIIDQAIARGKEHALRAGFSPDKDKKDFDAEVRKFVMNKEGSAKKEMGLYSWKHQNKTKAALLDMTNKNIEKRLDKKLVEEPLRKYLKDQAKKLKKMESDKIPLGREMTRQLEADARKWAEKNLVSGEAGIERHLRNMKQFMRDQGDLSAKKAAKRFSDDKNLRNNYLQELRNRQFDKDKGDHRRARFAAKGATDFMDKVADHRKSWYNLNRGILTQGSQHKEARDAAYNANLQYLSKGGTQREKEQLNDYYDKKLERAKELRIKEGKETKQERDLEKKRKKKLAEIDRKREYYKASLEHDIRQRAEMQKRQNSDKIGEMRKKAAAEVKRLKAAQERKTRELIGNENWKKIANKNGGLEAYRDGFVDIDGKTLYEAQALERALYTKDEWEAQRDERAGDGVGLGAAPILDLQNEAAKLDAELKEFDQGIDELEKKFEENKDDFDVSLFPNMPESKFGGNLDDVLGVQAGDAGVTTGDKAVMVDQGMLNACEMSKSYAQSKQKMKDFECKVKEYELSKMADDDPMKSRLQSEVADLKHEVDKLDKEAKTLDGQISDLKNGY